MTKESVYPWHTANWESLLRREARLPHALLLYGPAGTGIEQCAESWIRAMLCENRPAHGYACGSCQSCHWFDQHSHPDYRLILPEALALARGMEPADTDTSGEGDTTGSAKTTREPSRKIGIDAIRNLSDFLHLSTHRGGLRIVSIYPAEAMTSESSNALLKMLEEPPSDTLFVLVSHHLDALLPTIVSRCAKQAFSMPATPAALAWLTAQGIDDAEYWLAEQGGAPLAALEQAQHGNREALTLLLDEMAAPDGDGVLATAEKLQKIPMNELLTWHQRWLYDLLSLSLTGELRYYPRYRTQLEKLASTVRIDRLLTLLRTVNERKKNADHPLVPRLALEDMLLDYRKIFPVPAHEIR